MKITNYTSLTRSIVLSYNTNLYIVIVSVLLALATASVSHGLLIFILWALARELDVKHDWSAFIGIPLAVYFMTIGFEFSNLFLFTLLISSRFFSKTNEVKIMKSDYVIVAVLWLLTFLGNSIFLTGNFYYLFAMFLGIGVYKFFTLLKKKKN